MEIQEVAIEDLKPSEYNPRRGDEDQYKQLKASLTDFGVVEPLVVNKHAGRENVVVGGHFRLRVLRDLGHKTVPVIFVDLTLEREQELNIRLNKNVGDWDWEMLANLNHEMLIDVGFQPFELGLEPIKPLEDREKDSDPSEGQLDSYIKGTVKSVVLYFSAEDFARVIQLLNKKMKELGVKNYSELITKLIGL